MREFTKSIMSYSWAMSLFGVQQMLNLLTPSSQQANPATSAFENVTRATEEEFDRVIKSTFRVGDNIQRGLIDLTFNALTLGMSDTRRTSRAASDPVNASNSQSTGWGPIPPVDDCGQRRRRA